MRRSPQERLLLCQRPLTLLISDHPLPTHGSLADNELGVASAIIIASCIKENGMLKELKCAARPKSVCFCISAR